MTRGLKRMILFSIALAGFSSASSQIVLLREFLIVFSGNELSIGFLFISWFASGFLGSWFLGALSERLNLKITAFSLCQFLLSVLFPLSILFVRSIRFFLGISSGELIPFFSILALNFIILLPICGIFGFMFALGAKIVASEAPDAEIKIASVYIAEAAGSILAGILVGFILIRKLSSVEVMAILGTANILCAIFLQLFRKEKKPLLTLIFVFTFFIFSINWVFSGWKHLHEAFLKKQWVGYQVLAAENSIYGNIIAARTANQYSLFYNGGLLYSYPEEIIAEESAHLPLLELEHPKQVLLIGGGPGNLIAEILKHPIERLDYIELDPLLVKIGRDTFPSQQTAFLKDKRVNIYNIDARAYIKRAREKYDCIIMCMGAPATAALNRYYTVEFFKEARRILKEDGVFSFSLSSSESFIGASLRDLLASVYSSLKTVLTNVIVMPGETAYFLASPSQGMLTYDYNILERRAQERALKIKYVRPYYLAAKLQPEKIHYIQRLLDSASEVKLNYDFRPSALYYDMIFLSSRFRDSFLKKILGSVNERKAFLAFIAVIMFIVFLALSVKRRSSKEKLLLAAVSVTGFTQMSFQMMLYLSFQIIYGYLYYKLAFLIASFMAGLTLGSLWMIYKMPRLKSAYGYFMKLEFLVCLYPLLLVFFINAKNINASEQVIINFLPALSGFLAGAQFNLANKIFLQKSSAVGKVAGLTYGMDLLGSCLGAFLTAIFFIPLLGIAKTCFAAVVLNLSILSSLYINRS